MNLTLTYKLLTKIGMKKKSFLWDSVIIISFIFSTLHECMMIHFLKSDSFDHIFAIFKLSSKGLSFNWVQRNGFTGLNSFPIVQIVMVSKFSEHFQFWRHFLLH